MSERDELLERLLCGDLEPESAEARAALEADPELCTRFEAARETLALLEAAAADRRRLAEEVQAGGSVPGEDRVEAFVRQRAPAPAARRPSRWRHALALAAAIAVVAFVLTTDFWRGPSPVEPPPDDRVLGGAIQRLAPSGEVDDFERFTWVHELEPGGWYEVTVRGAEDDPFEIDSGPLEEPAWEPVGTEAWPRAIVWEVVAHDATGGLRGSAAAEARRRRP